MNHISSLGTLNGNSSESSYIATDESQMVVSELMKASYNELNSSESFQLLTQNSDTLQIVGVHEVEDAASCSHMKEEHPSCVEEELSVDYKMPSPQTVSDHLVVDLYQKISKCDSQMQMFNKDDDLMDISNSDLEEMADEELLSGAQTEVTVRQPGSKHIVEHSETGSDIFLEDFQTTESKNIADIELLTLKSIVDHESDCSLDAEKEPEGVDDTTSNRAESAQSPCNSNRSNPKPASLKIKPLPNAFPFSDEWLAAIEAAGEDILTLKSGAVQHSPPDKSASEPSPWSPVKRHKNQELGPFDCTKHTNVPQPPADDQGRTQEL